MRRALPTLTHLRLLLGTAGGLSLLLGGGISLAAPVSSPLLAQSQDSQALALRMMDMIRTAAGGQLTEDNATGAVQSTITASPGITLGTMAAALEQMKLEPGTLKNAISGVTSGLGIPHHKVLGAMISHTYMSEGKQAAQQRVKQLRGLYDADTVDMMLDTGSIGALSSPEDLAQIEPTAGSGLYDG